MLNEHIEALTAKLEQLRLEQDQLRTQERELVEELVATLKEPRDTNTDGPKPLSPGRDKEQKKGSAK